MYVPFFLSFLLPGVSPCSAHAQLLVLQSRTCHVGARQPGGAVCHPHLRNPLTAGLLLVGARSVSHMTGSHDLGQKSHDLGWKSCDLVTTCTVGTSPFVMKGHTLSPKSKSGWAWSLKGAMVLLSIRLMPTGKGSCPHLCHAHIFAMPTF